jgi:methylated-DNA-[protein]-cysteine S-methyltransferase
MAKKTQSTKRSGKATKPTKKRATSSNAGAGAGVLACTFPTAIGTMALAWRESKIVGVFLPEESDDALLAQLRKRTRNPELEPTQNIPAFVGHLAAQIRAHLRGEPQEFGVDHLELPVRGPFIRKVYEMLQRVPNGKVLTYRELAEKAGSPKAFRAVGQAMAKNPFPIVIPCHRVVGTTRNAGGFSAHGGLDTKARILEIESPRNPA